MEIIHFSHRHPLALSHQTNNQVRCFACRLPISSGPAYVCASCKYFIHKFCGELPQQIDHPFHPLHPLSLGRPPHRSGKFYCNACSDLPSGFVFSCSQCDFNLDIVCASLRPSTQIENHEQENIELFSHHPHPFIPFTCCEDKYYKIKCSVCYRAIKGLIYVCIECEFFVHKSCAQLPLQIRHPFHPPHDLSLRAKKLYDGLVCYACNRKPYGFTYHCSECSFELDILCSGLRPTTYEGNQEEQIEHFSHEHHLTPVPCGGDTYNIACCLCSMDVKNVDGSIYVCFDCKYFLHKSCAELPIEIQNHPFHPQDSLALTPGRVLDEHGNCVAIRYCHVCDKNCENVQIFCCSTCEFRICITCATLMPTIGNEQYERQIHHSHVHSLIPFDDGKTCALTCRGCRGIVGNSGYICLQCNPRYNYFRYLLCRSCAESPEEIEHPFHPQHRLKMVSYSSTGNGCCNACGSPDFRIAYQCEACQFYLHIKCASLPTVNYARHEHPLAVFTGFNRYKCHNCSASCCSMSFLRCVLCDLNLHVECIPLLPHTVKIETHKHRVMLNDSPPEDGSDLYYCNACEGERNPKHPIYSCAECEYVAHLECGLSEEVISMEKESLVVRQLLDMGFEVFPYTIEEDSEDRNEIENDLKKLLVSQQRWDRCFDSFVKLKIDPEDRKERENDEGSDAKKGTKPEDMEEKEKDRESDATGGTDDEDTNQENDCADSSNSDHEDYWVDPSEIDDMIKKVRRQLKNLLQRRAHFEANNPSQAERRRT